MADSFNLIRTPKLVFGPGKVLDLPSLIKGKGHRILVITGSGSHRNNKSVQDTFDRLTNDKNQLAFESIASEPSPADIDRITGNYAPDEIDLVIALGGGSVIDAGKAVAAMLKLRGNVRDYLEGVGTKYPSGEKLFFVAVPTTAGTGSEATSNAVISETGEKGFKKSLRHENYVPDVAIVDPSLTLSCPASITAASGMDAFTQLLESYLSVKSCSFTDALALDGISHIKGSIEKAVSNGEDIHARSGMAYAAYLSGITLANAGLGLIHGFASSIGGYYSIPHGLVCGTMMSVVNRYSVNSLMNQSEHTRAHEKYAMAGKLLSGTENRNTRWYMEFVADYIEKLTDTFKIKRLGEFGVRENDLHKIALATDHKSNPVKFDHDSLIEMLRNRL